MRRQSSERILPSEDVLVLVRGSTTVLVVTATFSAARRSDLVASCDLMLVERRAGTELGTPRSGG